MLAIVTRAAASFRDLFRGVVSSKSVAVCVLIAASGACGFPSYGYRNPAGSAGNAGAGIASGGPSVGGSAGTAGGSPVIAGTGGTAAVAGAPAGGSTTGGTSGGGATGGGAPTCVAAGSAGAEVPSHCSDGSKDSDEPATDCGGSCSPCTHTEACHADTDCSSALCTTAKTCAPLVELDLGTIVDTRATYTLQFKLSLKYLHPVDKTPLKDITLRYYFARGDAAEPIAPYATQAVYNDMAIDDEVRWTIQRVLVDPKTLTDMYLEISFPSSKKTLLQGDVVDVTQSIQAGNALNHMFDQLTHYSFRSTTDLSASERVTVFRAGQLIWGTPPAYNVPEQCFATAVNFGGDALTSGVQHYLSGADPSVLFTGDSVHYTGTPFPTPDTGFLPLVQTAVLLDTAHAVWRVPNGPYWLYPYLISADGTNQGDLTVQGDDVVTFAAGKINGFAAWARVGPYRITVKDGGLDFGSASGALRLAGAELYQVAQ